MIYLIYFGEVRINPNEVYSFYKAAGQLQITGIEFSNNEIGLHNIPILTPHKSEQYFSSFNTTNNEWVRLHNQQLAFHVNPVTGPFQSSEEEKLISSVEPQITLPNSKDWPLNTKRIHVPNISQAHMQNNYPQKDAKRLVESHRTDNLKAKANHSSMKRIQARLNEYNAAITLQEIFNSVANRNSTPKNNVVFSDKNSLETQFSLQRPLIRTDETDKSDKVRSLQFLHAPKKISKSLRLTPLESVTFQSMSSDKKTPLSYAPRYRWMPQ